MRLWPVAAVVVLLAVIAVISARRSPPPTEPPLQHETEPAEIRPASLEPRSPPPAAATPEPPPRLIDLPPRVVRGRVVDQAGAPLAGASVGVNTASGGTVVSDANGAFSIANVPPEPVTVYAVAPGRAAAQRRVEAADGFVELILSRGARLRARLQTAPRHELLASVCRPRGVDPNQLCVARVVVAAGQHDLSFADLPPGSHELVLQRDDQELARIAVTTRSDHEVVLDDLRTGD